MRTPHSLSTMHMCAVKHTFLELFHDHKTCLRPDVRPGSRLGSLQRFPDLITDGVGSPLPPLQISILLYIHSV